jgi:hypothetical protein
MYSFCESQPMYTASGWPVTGRPKAALSCAKRPRLVRFLITLAGLYGSTSTM